MIFQSQPWSGVSYGGNFPPLKVNTNTQNDGVNERYIFQTMFLINLNLKFKRHTLPETNISHIPSKKRLGVYFLSFWDKRPIFRGQAVSVRVYFILILLMEENPAPGGMFLKPCR